MIKTNFVLFKIVKTSSIKARYSFLHQYSHLIIKMAQSNSNITSWMIIGLLLAATIVEARKHPGREDKQKVNVRQKERGNVRKTDGKEQLHQTKGFLDDFFRARNQHKHQTR